MRVCHVIFLYKWGWNLKWWVFPHVTPRKWSFLVGKTLWLLGKPTICSETTGAADIHSTLLQVAGLEEELKEKAVVVAEKAPGRGRWHHVMTWGHEDLMQFFIMEVHQFWNVKNVRLLEIYRCDGMRFVWNWPYMYMNYIQLDVLCRMFVLHSGSFWIICGSLLMCDWKIHLRTGRSTLRVFSVMVLVITGIVDVSFPLLGILYGLSVCLLTINNPRNRTPRSDPQDP